jgi:hypothetical protein
VGTETTRVESNPSATEQPGRRELFLGLLFGFCALIGVAIILSIADPYFRDPGGVVFSLSISAKQPGD